MRAPPVESRRVAADGPAPRQRRDGIFGERRVGVEQQERVAARRGHGVDEGPAAATSGRRDDRRAEVSRYVRRRIRRAAIRHNYFERRAVARQVDWREMMFMILCSDILILNQMIYSHLGLLLLALTG